MYSAGVLITVWRIRDVYPGSDFFPSRIPDPNISIPDPGSASKNLRILTQKMVSKLKEICLCCSSRIRIPDPNPDLLHIPDIGSRSQKAPDPGSATLPLTIHQMAIENCYKGNA